MFHIWIGTNENGRAIAPNPGSNLPNPYGQNGNQQWYVSGQNFNPQPFGFNQNPNFQQVPFGQNVYSQYGAGCYRIVLSTHRIQDYLISF